MDFKLSQEYQIYKTIYAFHKKYFEVSCEDDYWSKCLKEAREIDKKYDSKFCREMLAAVVLDLNRRATVMRDGDD